MLPMFFKKITELTEFLKNSVKQRDASVLNLENTNSKLEIPKISLIKIFTKSEYITFKCENKLQNCKQVHIGQKK